MRPVVRSDRFAGFQPVVTQDEIRCEGGLAIDGTLNTGYPERARKIMFADNSCRYTRSVMGWAKDGGNSRLSDGRGKEGGHAGRGRKNKACHGVTCDGLDGDKVFGGEPF